MAINKVVYNGETLIDLTNSTATPDNTASGVIGYGADGEQFVGRMSQGNVEEDYIREIVRREITGVYSEGIVPFEPDWENKEYNPSGTWVSSNSYVSTKKYPMHMMRNAVVHAVSTTRPTYIYRWTHDGAVSYVSTGNGGSTKLNWSDEAYSYVAFEVAKTAYETAGTVQIEMAQVFATNADVRKSCSDVIAQFVNNPTVVDLTNDGNIPYFIEWEHGNISSDGTNATGISDKNLRTVGYITTRDVDKIVNLAAVPSSKIFVNYYNNDKSYAGYVDLGATEVRTEYEMDKTYPYARLNMITYSDASHQTQIDETLGDGYRNVILYRSNNTVISDDHINALIDAKLGVIENGYY